MKNLSPEMIEQAKQTQSADELLAMAKENGMEMTAEEAQACFARLHSASSELDDDELDDVSGGGCGGSSSSSSSESSEQSTVTLFCSGCSKTVQVTRRLDTEGDIDGYFGTCPNCGKLHFNL